MSNVCHDMPIILPANLICASTIIILLLFIIIFACYFVQKYKTKESVKKSF